MIIRNDSEPQDYSIDNISVIRKRMLVHEDEITFSPVICPAYIVDNSSDVGNRTSCSQYHYSKL